MGNASAEFSRREKLRRFLTLLQVCGLAGCAHGTLREAIDRGEIRPTVARQIGTARHLLLFTRADAEAYAERLRGWVGVPDIAERLHVGKNWAKALLEAGILPCIERLGFKGCPRSDLDGLLARLRQLPAVHANGAWSSMVRLRQGGKDDMQLLISLLRGDLVAARDDRVGSLCGVVVRTEDVQRFRREARVATHASIGANVRVIAPQLGVGTRVVRRWIAEGLLSSVAGPHSARLVTPQALAVFKQRYMLAAETVQALGIHSRSLAHFVRNGHLHSVRAGSDERSVLLFERSDVEALANVMYVSLGEAEQYCVARSCWRPEHTTS